MKEMMSQSIQNLKIGIGSFFKMEVEKIPSCCPFTLYFAYEASLNQRAFL
jgi:hypothetical protein